MITKPTEIKITDGNRLSIYRPHHDGSWVKGAYRLEKLTPSTLRRLAAVLSTAKWSHHTTESWYESGYGYDYYENDWFDLDPNTQHEQFLAMWLESMIPEGK